MKINFANKQYNVKYIAQYDGIKYSKNFCCSCGYVNYLQKYSYNIVGYVNTSYGYMIVCECLKCFEKFRYHIGTKERYNFKQFKKQLGLELYLNDINIVTKSKE